MPRIHRPFKGAWFYEWQVGSLVIQWRHADRATVNFPKLNIWRCR